MAPTNSTVAAKLGARIKELRSLQAIPCDVVAKSVGMTEEDYEAGERGEKTFRAEQIYLIAKTLGIDASAILSGL